MVDKISKFCLLFVFAAVTFLYSQIYWEDLNFSFQDSDSARVLNDSGMALYNSEYFTGAEMLFCEAFELDSTYLNAVTNWACAVARQNRSDHDVLDILWFGFEIDPVTTINRYHTDSDFDDIRQRNRHYPDWEAYPDSYGFINFLRSLQQFEKEVYVDRDLGFLFSYPYYWRFSRQESSDAVFSDSACDIIIAEDPYVEYWADEMAVGIVGITIEVIPESVFRMPQIYDIHSDSLVEYTADSVEINGIQAERITYSLSGCEMSNVSVVSYVFNRGLYQYAVRYEIAGSGYYHGSGNYFSVVDEALDGIAQSFRFIDL